MHSYSIYMDHFPPPHKQETISSILNKTTPLAKIKSLTEATSAYLGLLCTTVLAINCRISVAGGCKGDMWQEVANCPVLLKTGSSLHWNRCKQSTACQNFNRRCAQCLCLNILKQDQQLLARGAGKHIRRRYSWGNTFGNTCRETEELLLGKYTEKTLRTCTERHSQKDILHAWGDSLLRGLWPTAKPCQSRYTSEVTQAHRRPKLEQAHPWRDYGPVSPWTVTLTSPEQQRTPAKRWRASDKPVCMSPTSCAICHLTKRIGMGWVPLSVKTRETETTKAGRRGVRLKLSLRKGRKDVSLSV